MWCRVIVKVGRVLAKQLEAGQKVVLSSQRRANPRDIFCHKGQWYTITAIEWLPETKSWAHHFENLSKHLVFHVHQFDSSGWCHCGIGRELEEETCPE